MRSLKLERWLPTLGLFVGLLFMAVAVALGQGSAPPAPAAAPSANTQEPGAPDFANWHVGDRRHERFRGTFARVAPEAVCKERFAREVGFLAYLGAKLDLTASQQPLWDAYHRAMLLQQDPEAGRHSDSGS